MKASIEKFGLIEACKKHAPQCHHMCCSFADNYIVLYPHEYETAKSNKSHLQIIDEDYFGGKKAICVRPCSKNDFKPLDCRSYPFFPRVNEQGEIEVLRGRKCPLKTEELVNHRREFLKVWRALIKDSMLLQWIKNIELVGYEVEDT